MSPLTLDRLATLLPSKALPAGPLKPRANFGRQAPVVLEIGCGHGAAAIAYALAHPDHDVIAVDVHTPGIARMLAAAADVGVDNLWVEIGDAVKLLEDRVPSQALSAIHVFFPDPWPKAKHAKRRLIRPAFLDVAHDRLGTQGQLLIATDDAGYAQHVQEEFAAHGRFDVTLGERPVWRPVDGFEAKGLAAGRRITEVRAIPL